MAFRASFSSVICDSSAVSDVTVFADKDPIFARGCIEYLAIILLDEVGPRP
jgi:hypothetical protein